MLSLAVVHTPLPVFVTNPPAYDPAAHNAAIAAVIAAIITGLTLAAVCWQIWLARRALKATEGALDVAQRELAVVNKQTELMQAQADIVNRQLEHKANLEILIPQGSITLEKTEADESKGFWSVSFEIYNSGSKSVDQCRVAVYLPNEIELVNTSVRSFPGKRFGRHWLIFETEATQIFPGEHPAIFGARLYARPLAYRANWKITTKDGPFPPGDMLGETDLRLLI